MNQRLWITLIIIVLILGLLGASVIFFAKAKDLDLQLEQSKGLLQKMQEEAVRLEGEKIKIVKDNERLQADGMVYLEQNNNLQQEKLKLKEMLGQAQKIIKVKEADLEKLKQNIEKAEKQIKEDSSTDKEKLAKERTILEEEFKLAESNLQNERGLYHYNLGVAYIQAGFYGEAIEAYEKALFYNPGIAEAHFNLGLLYNKYQQDSDKAIVHYRKYLELNPEAEDKEEIKAIIKRLE
jgi:tetratricopeptide (TPR) repeat protein